MITRYDSISLPNEMIDKYLLTLINRFFKILPMKESNEPSLKQFMSSLQCELVGFKSLMISIDNDAMYLRLLAILEYLIQSDCETSVVKREVFKAIKLCKELRIKYCLNLKEEV